MSPCCANCWTLHPESCRRFSLRRWPDFERQTQWGVLLLFGGGLTLRQVAERLAVLADAAYRQLPR